MELHESRVQWSPALVRGVRGPWCSYSISMGEGALLTWLRLPEGLQDVRATTGRQVRRARQYDYHSTRKRRSAKCNVPS